MKKKIEDALRTEYASLGLSDKTIGRLADYVQGLVEKEDDIVTAVKRDDVKLIAKSIQGEIDGIKRAKDAAEAALADYKAKHPEGDDGDKDKDKPQDIAAIVQAAIEKATQPLVDEVNALKQVNSTKAALDGAREKFFAGDYAKKYKDDADSAWERAVEINEVTGNKMSAEELANKATSYFNASVSKKGVDTTKPLEPDTENENQEGTTDWSSEVQRLKDAGKLPKENK